MLPGFFGNACQCQKAGLNLWPWKTDVDLCAWRAASVTQEKQIENGWIDKYYQVIIINN